MRKFEIAPRDLWLTKVTHSEAVMHCTFLDYEGKGWRLPTNREGNILLAMCDNRRLMDSFTEIDIANLSREIELYGIWSDGKHTDVNIDDLSCSVPVRGTLRLGFI